MTGSKAPPAFPAPYACIPSIVLQPPFLSLLPAAGSKAQALWSTRQPTPNIPESGPATARQPLSLLHYVRMFVSHRLLSAKHKVFYCFISLTYVTSKPFAVLSLYGRRSCSLSLYSDDALSSLSTGAGGASVVTPRTERSQQPNVNYVARTSSVCMTGSHGAGTLGFI